MSARRAVGALVGASLLLAGAGCDRAPTPAPGSLTRAQADARYDRDVPAILAGVAAAAGRPATAWTPHASVTQPPSTADGECRVHLVGFDLADARLPQDDALLVERLRTALRGHGEWVVDDDVAQHEAWRTVTAWERDGGRLRVDTSGAPGPSTQLSLDAALRPQECGG